MLMVRRDISAPASLCMTHGVFRLTCWPFTYTSVCVSVHQPVAGSAARRWKVPEQPANPTSDAYSTRQALRGACLAPPAISEKKRSSI